MNQDITYDEPLLMSDFEDDNASVQEMTDFTEAFDDSISYDEPLMPIDFGIEEPLTEEYEEDEGDTSSDLTITEDLKSSYPVTPMSEQQVRDACKKVVKGAKVRFGYVLSLKLDAKYAQGKFVKKENKQYELVRAIKVTETRACTGVRYDRTAQAKLLHATQEYQDKIAARQAAGLGGFGTNVHDAEAGMENILVTTATGKKCILAYPLSTMMAHNTYYISIDGSDWREATKEEIAQYMTAGEAAKFLHPEIVTAEKAMYQSKILNQLGQSTAVDDELTIRDTYTNELIKIKTSPIQPCYMDPADPFKCVFQIDKESAIQPVPVNTSALVDDNPLTLDFPDVTDTTRR